MKVSYAGVVMLGLLLVTGLAASGVGEDFVSTSEITGLVDIIVPGDTIPTYLLGTGEQTYVTATSLDDSIAGYQRWTTAGYGTALFSTDGGQTFGSWKRRFRRFLINLIIKIIKSLCGESLVLGSPFAANSAVIQQEIGRTGDLLTGMIRDSVVLAFDGLHYAVGGYEVYPDSELDFNYPVERIEQRVDYTSDGKITGFSTIRVSTNDRGITEIPITISGTYVASNSRIPLPARIEGVFSMTGYDTLTGVWTGAGEILAKPLQVPTLTPLGLVALLVLLILSGVALYVMRRRRAVGV